VITSPFPQAECGRRLAAVTARSQVTGYLRPVFAGGPRPRLYGQVSLVRARVARVDRSRLEVRFDGAIHAAPDGGTVLHGTVGPSPVNLPAYVGFSVVWAVIATAMIAAGVGGVVSGSGPGLPFLLVPGFLIAFYITIMATLPGQIRREAQRLVDELGEVLGATATMET
jgi:hypothetical protein